MIRFVTCTCKVCKKDYRVPEGSHPAFKQYCENHLTQMLEEYDAEAIE